MSLNQRYTPYTVMATIVASYIHIIDWFSPFYMSFFGIFFLAHQILNAYHADHWFLLRCCVFRTDAASIFMGAGSAYSFNANSTGIKYENAFAILFPSHYPHCSCLVLFLFKFSAISFCHKHFYDLNTLLCICQWDCCHAYIDLPMDFLHGCQHACFYQEMVSGLSLFPISITPEHVHASTNQPTHTRARLNATCYCFLL